MSLPITERDLKLFRAFDEFGILSTRQIRNLFFQELDRSNVLRRLRRHEKRKLLRKFYGLPKGELVWGLTERGARGIGSSTVLKTINRNSLEHDILAADIKMKLDACGIGANWISAYAIQRMKKEKIESDRIPDWVFTLHLPGKSITCALEVEIHMKGKQRMELILDGYARKKDIPLVWYVVPSDSFGKKLLDQVSERGGFLENNWLVYSLFDEILNDPLNTRVCGQGSTAPIKNFCKVNSCGEEK